jgi:hypothetical protein
MLNASICLLGLVALAGIGLAALAMLGDRAPAWRGWPASLHGLGGVAGFSLLLPALWRTPPSPHAIRMGASGFGIAAAALLGVALAAGIVLLSRHLGRRPPALHLIAVHGLLAIGGFTLLLAYAAMLH